jgi:hypothetical protein
MDQALLVLLLVTGVSGAVALVLALRFLPWPARVRTTVALATMSDSGFAPMCPPPDVREVQLTSALVRGNEIEVRMIEVGRSELDVLVFAGAAPTVEVTSMMQEWSSLRTPILLYVDAHGLATLCGPMAAVGNLRRPGARALTAR